MRNHFRHSRNDPRSSPIIAAMTQYAVVCYLNGGPAKFAESLRAQLAPQQSHLRAHITLLPPRLIPAGETLAAQALHAAGSGLGRLRISFDEVQSFLPLHPTVYLRVHHGARHLRSIYETLNAGYLAAADPWPYVPHLTIATLSDALQTRSALAQAVTQWQKYAGERELTLNQMTLVREDTPEHWIDLDTVLWEG